MNEIVFQNPSKCYRAYKIRKTYLKNVIIGLAITISISIKLPHYLGNNPANKKTEAIKQAIFEPADLPLLPISVLKKKINRRKNRATPENK